MLSRNKIALSFVALTALTVGLSQEFEPSNHPDGLNMGYEKRASVLHALPMQASLPIEKMPASDDYYADQDEGIARRWNDGNDHDYAILTKDQVLAMSPEEIAKLSPPEKFDIYLGDYSNGRVFGKGFGLTRRVKKQSKDRGEDRGWEGICHGWTSSGINHAEPLPVTLKNADGVEIRFGSSDVKALLSYSYTSRSGSGYNQATQIGGRCGLREIDPNLPIPTSCTDVNAGAFHVVVLNQIGIKKEAFAADIDNTLQVWNQPISGYKILSIEDVPGYDGMAANAVKAQKIQMVMEYVSEVHPRWEPVVGTRAQNLQGRAYEYMIDLNAAGEIVGGKWLRFGSPTMTENEDGSVNFLGVSNWAKITHIGARQHPDFLWLPKPAPRLGIWKKFMEEVYKPREH